MFQIGDHIVYGGEGVCAVKAIGALPVPGMDSDRLYYTLEPLYHGGVIYAPLDTPVPMRPVLSRDEAEGLISSIPAMRSQYARQADS